jgi:two-component system NtrC family sensor kinase
MSTISPDLFLQETRPQLMLQTILGVMNEVPVGICMVDKDLQIQLVNRRAKQLLDLPDHLFEPKLPHFSAVIAFNAERGDYGPGDTAEHVSRIQALAQRMEPHHFERKRPNGQVLDIRGEPLPGGGFVTIWTDVTARAQAEEAVIARNTALEQLNADLQLAQQQLVQSEKLASIGQLAAGVAHEINNPIGYVSSNISAMESYVEDLFRMLDGCEAACAPDATPEQRASALRLRAEIDLDFLKEDIPNLMRESLEGITRVKKIVQDLKDFSHADTHQEWKWADLHQGIESTINIVASEVKYKADVVREFGALPDIECLPTQLNQVFMNLLVNAAHAMGDVRGTITIRTGIEGESVWLEFSDNGSGIPPEVQARIFDPFFTTKPIGKGTGLGLSLAYGIIQKHKGKITLDSAPGRGTTFRIVLPITRTPSESE